MSKVFKRDWFGRSEEDSYVPINREAKLIDWEENVGRRSYSSYFLREQKGLKEAARIVGSMFSVVGVPKKAHYTSQEIKKASADSKLSVHIPIKMLQDDDGQFMDHDSELLDAFYGAAIQNGALAAMQTTSEYNYTITKRQANDATTVKDLLFSVVNTERIEKKVADRFPGYAKFLQKNKDRQYKDYTPLDISEPANKRLFELVMQMLRYPGEIDPETLKEFAKPIEAIERMIKRRGGMPETMEQAKGLATSLYNIIDKYEIEEEEKEEDEGGGGAGPAGASDEDMKDFAKDMMSLMMGDAGDDASDELLDDFAEGMDTPEKKEFKRNGEFIANTEKVKFIPAIENKELYLKILEKVDTTKAAVLAKLFARKSKDQAIVIKSMRSGRLDTNKIAEAAQNVPTIYERYGSIKTNKVCVGVLIDESGSMSSCSRIEKAREAAIFINEIFKKMHDVELFMYGHTADQDGTATAIRIYREPGVNMPHALGSVRARGNNRDGDAILATAQRIRNMTNNTAILFVISDGQPSAHNYGGQSAIDDTRHKVKKAEALGFQVIQIAIDESVPSEEMFTHFVKMTDIASFPKTFVGYMSRKVDSLIKSKITM